MSRRPSQYLRKRFSAAPLMAQFPAEMSSREIAILTGLSCSTVLKYRSGQREVDWRTADRVAVKLGRHPMTIWSKEWCEMVVDEPR